MGKKFERQKNIKKKKSKLQIRSLLVDTSTPTWHAIETSLAINMAT